MNLPNIGKIYREQRDSIFIEIPESGLLKVLEDLKGAGIKRVADISGYDNGKEIELIYRLPYGNDARLLNLKVRISRKNPKVRSALELFPSAYLYERETHEFLGVVFEGHPDMKRMLLTDGSPRAPLRKQVKEEVKKDGGKEGV